MSSSDLEAKLLRGAAYRIFFDEVQKHLDGITVLCDRAELSAQEVAEAAGRFHTIKGGAGFFKLVELAGVAGALENGLKGVAPAQIREKLCELEPLLVRLRAAVAALPQPAPEGY
jgi:chemotaxis protein histidine kinase CheA